MYFADPALQYNFRLPLGWTYDLERSHLITVIFRRWDQEDESVSVRAMPTFAPPDVSLDDWYQAVDEQAFPPRMLPATQIWAGSYPAALAEAHDQDPAPVHRRILIVRGTRLDVVIEHRSPEPSGGPRHSQVLRVIGESLDVPTNRFLPEPVDADEVMQNLNFATEAVQRRAWQEAIPPAMQALKAAQSMYLYTVVANTPLPEIPAILVQLHAAFRLGQAAGDILLLRHVEQLAMRAIYTLERLPLVSPQRRQQLHYDLLQGLEAAANLQASIVQSEGIVSSIRPSPGLGLAHLRSDYLAQKASQMLAQGYTHLAMQMCEAAVADLLAVVRELPMRSETFDPGRLAPETIEKYKAAGAETNEQVRELFLQLSVRVKLEDLTRELRLLADLYQISDNFVGAAEASEFLIPILERLAQPLDLSFGGQLQPPQGVASEHAQALIAHASSLVDIGDTPSLDEAQRLLDEADDLLGDEEPALHAHLCLVRASVLHAERKLEGALKVIERGLRAAAKQPDMSRSTVQELKTIQSQFLLNAGDWQAAYEIALEVVSLPEGDTPREVRNRAAHYLNLAIIQMQGGDFDSAGDSLHKSMDRAVRAAPFSEAAYRILMVSSRLFSQHGYSQQDGELAHDLNMAALANLDARYARISSDSARIGFDETSLHRQSYADVIERLIEEGDWPQAATAADRSRARSLNRLIAPPAGNDRDLAAGAHTLPSLKDLDQKTAFQAASDMVMAQADAEIRRLGVFQPLDMEEIQRAGREIGVPFLFIQPVNDRIALIMVQPDGEVRIHDSPSTRREVLDTSEKVYAQLELPRSQAERGDLEQKRLAKQALDMHLADLWLSLIGPVSHLIGQDQPLMIAPYREFTLVPFALLRDPDGVSLIERHAFAITPSMATISALRSRGDWKRPRPGRAYVAGDPAFNARFRLRRLPASRAEAVAVAANLDLVMTKDDNLMLRVDSNAHEESYRGEARGCDLVHLSCHAQLGEPAYMSRLVLAPYEQQDGLLMSAEIVDVKLNDGLVFLGACKTGRGRVTADGVVGLGRAFLEAGARAVVLSLWSVQDEATHALTTHFYQSFLSLDAHPSAAEALQQAMLKTREDLRAGRILVDGEALEDHPQYWAPFFILGDAFAIRYTPQD